MSKAMRRLNSAERRIVDLMARMHVMAELDRNVEGLGGILQYSYQYLDTEERCIWDAFVRRVPEVKADMLRTMKKAGWDSVNSGG